MIVASMIENRDQPRIEARLPLVRLRRCGIGTHACPFETLPIHSTAPRLRGCENDRSDSDFPRSTNLAAYVNVGTTDMPGPSTRCRFC